MRAMLNPHSEGSIPARSYKASAHRCMRSPVASRCDW